MSEYETKKCKPKAPEGFEHTGEWRQPKKNEWLLMADGGATLAHTDYWLSSYHILRPINKDKRVCLPDPKPGYEWVMQPRYGEVLVTYEQKRIKKLYDWSKTALYAVIDNPQFDRPQLLANGGDVPPETTLTKDWLYHCGGPCPFDAESVYVDVRYRDGDMGIGVDPIMVGLSWKQDLSGCDIIAVRFNSLKPGYEF